MKHSEHTLWHLFGLSMRYWLTLIVGGVLVLSAVPGCGADEDLCFAPRAITPVTCSTPIDSLDCAPPAGAGPAWNIDVNESLPGYDQELAGLDLCGMPDPIDMSTLSSYQRGFVAYGLEMEPDELTGAVPRATLLERGPMGLAVLGAFAKGAGTPDGLDFLFLRRGLHRFYTCSRGYPAQIEAFKAQIFDYTAIEPQVVMPSVKGEQTPRRIYIQTDRTCGSFVAVAETMDGDQVRETEVVISKTRADENLDFLAYDHGGALMDRSEFSAGSGNRVVAASPYVCMTCHLSNEDPGFKFDDVAPVR